MKAQPLRLVAGLDGNTSYMPCEPSEATHIMLNTPGPIPTRILPVMIKGTRAGTGNWTWNGDTEKPTLRPSVLSSCPPICERCHSFINDGQIQFLPDCTHELVNQTLDLLDVE